MEDVDNTEEFRCISLCSGYAGLELGLKRVVPNIRTVCYVEVEAFACANLVAKIEAGKLDAAPIWTDIKTFDGSPFRKRVHIIIAGYPCQPFSVAGKRKGTTDPRHLWPHIERIVQAVQPIWCFFENVSGHLTIGYPAVYRSLRNMGYKVEAGLFTAAEVGMPHKRERLFILGKKENTLWESMADSESSRSRRRIRNNQSKGKEIRGKCNLEFKCHSREGELADTTAQRTQRAEPEGTAQAGRQTDQQGNQWPARPGQPQYEWEEPRVVGYAPRKRLPKRSRGQVGRCGTPKSESKRPDSTTKDGQAQSRLGRAANGTPSRVDRLRLLGNGVVPHQAELAFRTLLALFKGKQ